MTVGMAYKVGNGVCQKCGSDFTIEYYDCNPMDFSHRWVIKSNGDHAFINLPVEIIEDRIPLSKVIPECATCHREAEREGKAARNLADLKSFLYKEDRKEKLDKQKFTRDNRPKRNSDFDSTATAIAIGSGFLAGITGT